MQLTTIDRQSLTLVSDAIVKALSDVETKFGVKIRTAGGNYGASRAMLKLEIDIKDTGNGKSGPQVQFERFASHYGLEPTDFGMNFVQKGKVYKVIGLETNRSKYPVLCERHPDRKVFCFPVATINNHRPAKKTA